MPTQSLPEGFLFGASTSAHQTEGNNVSSDWWALENAPDTFVDERSGDACDSYHRWREDLRLLADAGLNAYRFSIEWARIEPVAGRFSAAQIDHYAQMVSYAHELGIEPVVTLHHFTNPLWFSREYGWLHDEAADRFAAYVEAISPVLDAGVGHAVTINEPNMVAVMAAVRLGEGELDRGLGGGVLPVHAGTTDGLIAAHKRAREVLRGSHPELKTGWSVANQVVSAQPGGEEAADAYRERIEDVFLRAAIGDDFIAVQSYTRNIITPEGKVYHDPAVTRTQTGWEYYPPSIGEAIRHTAEVVGDMPVIVTENGIATADDGQRIDYTTGALASIASAMADGVDVRGYLHWSLLDNYEWGHYGPTFGLIAVDRTTFARTPKPSLSWLGAIAQRGYLA